MPNNLPMYTWRYYYCCGESDDGKKWEMDATG